MGLKRITCTQNSRSEEEQRSFFYQHLILIIQYLNNLIQTIQESLYMVLTHIEMVMYLTRDTDNEY